jgi:hypothetical protein
VQKLLRGHGWGGATGSKPSPRARATARERRLAKIVFTIFVQQPPRLAAEKEPICQVEVIEAWKAKSEKSGVASARVLSFLDRAA